MSIPTLTARSAAALLLLAAPVRAFDSEVVLEDARLSAPAPADLDNFGTAVALSGPTAAVTALRADLFGTDAGACFVFDVAGPTPALTQTLTVSDAGPFKLVAGSVALDGATLVLGVPTSSDVAVFNGAAYVFELQGGLWTETQKLVASDAQTLAQFGYSVALDGARMIVGAPDADGSFTQSGAAYVFHRVGGTWTEVQKIEGADAAAGDGFGWDVDLSGSTAIVGAPDDDDAGSFSGSAYVFTYLAGSWAQEQKLLASDLDFGDQFGAAVALDGDTCIVGAPQESTLGTLRGAAYVFQRAGFVWTEEQQVRASDGSNGAAFGIDVDLEGAVAVVGASGDAGIGAAYVLGRFGTTWTEHQKMIPSDGTLSSRFANRVALSNGRVLSGDDTAAGTGTAQGAAYVHTVVLPQAAVYCTAKTNSQGCLPQIAAVGVPSLSHPSPFDVSLAGALNQTQGLFFYGQSGRAALPFLGGTLCLQPPLQRGPVDFTGGNPPPSDCSGALNFDFNGWVQSGGVNLGPGTDVQGQFWYRDTAASFGAGLSDAVEFELCS